MYKFLFLFLIAFTTIQKISLAQNIDGLLIKINKLYKENRVLMTGKIQEIYLNKTNKTIDIDDKIIPLDNYSINYENSYIKFHKKNMNIVYIKCIEGNCILDRETKESNSALGFYFKTKKACYDFMNLLDEIRQLMIPH